MALNTHMLMASIFMSLAQTSPYTLENQFSAFPLGFEVVTSNLLLSASLNLPQVQSNPSLLMASSFYIQAKKRRCSHPYLFNIYILGSLLS